MDITITPSSFKGCVNIPPSKSMAHRAIICASLASGTSKIKNIAMSKDILATLDAMKSLGSSYSIFGDCVTIKGIEKPPKSADIDCNESGSTLRFLIPIAAALSCDARFFGKGKLPSRPITPYESALCKNGIKISRQENKMPICISGSLSSGEFVIDGNISSQFVTGLLFALPMLKGTSKIKINGRLESKPYVDITVYVMKQFGVDVREVPDGYEVDGNKAYSPFDLTVEGDHSQAAFFEVLGCGNEDLSICGLNKDSTQGDKEMLSTISACGGNFTWQNDILTMHKAKDLKSFTVDITDTPDLAPALAVLACICEGTSKIIGARRLKIKESDRIKAIADSLNALGAKIAPFDDSIEIEGIGRFQGGTADSNNDHRIAMACAVASAFSNSPVTILGAQCVEKSYPNFFEDFKKLGGLI